MEKTLRLDNRDRRILFELDCNSRAPFAELGRKTRIAADTVRYRVQRLSNAGVIAKCFTVIDSAKLGFTYYKFFLKLHNVNEADIEAIISYLAEHPSVVWLVNVDGSYDIGFAVKVRDIPQLSDLLDDLVTRFNQFINKRVFCVNVKGEYLTRDYLIKTESNRAATPSFYSIQGAPIPLDETNHSILQALTEDARTPAATIAKRLGLSSDAVLVRIARLEQDHVITRYNVVLNHAALQQIHYKVLLYLNHVSPDDVEKFVAYCKSQQNIVYVIKSLGEWDCELDLEVDDHRQLHRIMMELTREYSGIIRDYDALVINQIRKYNLYP